MPLGVPGLLVVAIVAVAWAVWLRRLKGATEGLWRWLPWVAAGIPVASLLATTWGLIRAFQAVSRASAETRQAELAEGIARAMWATGTGYLTLLIVLGLLAWGTWQERS